MAVVNSFQPIPVAATLTTNTMHHPQITSATLLRSSPKDQESLLEIHELLNSLFIRNRNQHRRNHWFKSLQQFRKQLGLLLQEMGTQGTTTGRSKYSARQIEERLTARLRYWDEKCIHQWYLHFTQLVAVGPFAVLGLVLMACTARTCRITGITALYEEIGSEDMKAALQMLDEGVAGHEISALLDAAEEEEDLGEVVERK